MLPLSGAVGFCVPFCVDGAFELLCSDGGSAMLNGAIIVELYLREWSNEGLAKQQNGCRCVVVCGQT